MIVHHDFLEGLAISAACASLPARKTYQKEPIAYSYNGVILPALPEWDREMYPYAVITKSWISTYCSLYVSKNVPYAYISDFSHKSTVIAWEGERIQIESIQDTEWEPETEWYTSNDSNVALKEDSWAWANCNIKMDGSVWLSTSDPLPVYE